MMGDFIYTLHPIFLTSLVLMSGIFISMFFLWMCRKFIKVSRVEEDTIVSGIYSAAFGGPLAILLGLIIVSAWTSYNQTTNQVRQEALDINTLYERSQMLDDEVQNTLREALKTYVTELINLEWPLLSQGGYSKKVDKDLFYIFEALVHAKRANKIDETMFQEMYDLISKIAEQRSGYILNSTSSVTPAMWIILIVSSITSFFLLNLITRPRLALHFLLQFLYSFGISLMLLLIIVLDRPFYKFGGVINERPFTNLLFQWEGNEIPSVK